MFYKLTGGLSLCEPYCYDLDEEVNIGQYNLNTIISRARIDRRIIEEGELLIMSCEELIKYKL